MRRLALLPAVSLLAVGHLGLAPSATASTTRTVVLTPVADTAARQQAATTPAGAARSLLSDIEETTGAATRATPYLRFTVPALAAGESVTGASLSLQVTNGTKNGQSVWRTDAAWTESALTWSGGQPARRGSTAIGGFGSVTTGRVSTAVAGVTGAGDVSLQLHADSTDGMSFASREDATAANRPQLVLTITSGAAATQSAPAAPTGVTATNDASGAATVRWAAPASDGGSPVTAYRVSRDGVDAAGTGAWSTTVSATARSFTFTKLAAGSTYRLSVQALNAAGAGTAVTRSVAVVPDAVAGTTISSDDAVVTVDPSGSSLVLTLADGSRQRVPMAAGDTYIHGLEVGLSREAFVARAAGRHDHVRVVYRDADTGISEFAVSGTGAYAAPSGQYVERWDDYGVGVTVDPSGTSLVLAGTGFDPVRREDAFGSLMLRFPLSARSTYTFAVRDHAANTLTPTVTVSREEFVARVRASEFVNDVAFSYDAGTGTGRFHVTGGVGPR